MDKEYAISLVEFALKELLPRHKNIYIDICFDEEMEDCGLCVENEHRDFTLNINPNYSLEEMEKTVFHEMVHVKQYVRGELKEVFAPLHRHYWKGEEVRSSEWNYMDLPWEKEAYDMEEVLWNKWQFKLWYGE